MGNMKRLHEAIQEAERLSRSQRFDEETLTSMFQTVREIAKDDIHPTADARGDGLLGRAAASADALGGSLDSVRGPQSLDLSCEFRNAEPGFGGRLCVRAGEARLELVTQSGELKQVGLVGEG